MHEKDLQIEPQLEVHKIEPQPKQKPIQSDLTEKYWEIMGKQHLSAQHISTLISKLSSQNISYEPHYFHETIYAKIIDHMPNYHILTLRVAYGYFKITLTIYCQEQESHSHNLSNIGNHQSSSVFVARNGNKSEVIKCYCIENPEQSIHVFGGALKQYFLMRIAQGLGVGPSLIKLGGFDMIMSQKCIEFGMEKCQQIINTQNLSKEMVENLVLNLKIMHTFNLVHVDIKPQNIMYSSIIQQLVYIDFGFSKLIKQKQGLRTKTEFAGTAQTFGQVPRQKIQELSIKQQYQKIQI